MSMLTVSVLVCAAVALTAAAAVPEAEPVDMTGPSTEEENQIVKRSTSCPGGWTEYNGRCFLYVPTPMTWANAEKYCQYYSGNLASVDSFIEYHMIQSMILRITDFFTATWLGGSDAQQEGTWFWSDGKPFRFNHWAPGQPDNHANAHCLLMNSGATWTFGDERCDQTFPAVCAIKP